VLTMKIMVGHRGKEGVKNHTQLLV